MNVAVIGMGQIGGSLLRALAGAGHWVVGYDLDPSTRAMARTGAALAPHDGTWQVAPSVTDALSSAQLVVVATPLTAVEQVFGDIAAAGFTGLVTDVVSVKEPVRAMAKRRLLTLERRLAGYVGGHPMTGRETTGYPAADPSIIEGCTWALCLDEETSLDSWLAVARLLTGLRVRVVPTTATDHDRVVAAVVQVPHLLAAALATATADPLAGSLAAGSFRDGSRVAATPPELFASMCAGNPRPVVAALDSVIDGLRQARTALSSRDPIAALRAWAAPAYAARSSWPRGWGEPIQLPATPDDLLALGDDGGWVSAIAPDGNSVTAARPISS